MNGDDMVAVLRTSGSSGWIDGVAIRIIQHAARNTPGALSDRLEEEWLADMSERRAPVSRLSFALGCYWAATVISQDHSAASAPATSSPTAHRTMMAYTPYRGSIFARATDAVPGAAMCDINTTPLIDVMLVLLVTLIISLPIMTHAVKLDLPRTPPTQDTIRPEVIDLDIDFDGTIVWNGAAIANLQQLDGFFRTEAQKDPQPEIHLRPDRGARYDVVARVLTSAQRNRIKKIGFVNTAEFND